MERGGVSGGGAGSIMKSVLTDLPADKVQEHFEDLLTRPGVKLERIVTYGQATPPGEWYDQAWDEWVMIVQGEAKLLMARDEQLLHMKPGDHVLLPAHCRHRVEWTPEGQTTIWLALHLGEPVD
ncbi:cupin domain-containing protein [Pontibacterium granulatum]|uniref:cupin domain-containing protein n=1 Tax=Pontibacterium granulatum TaxID=2036029 RepID=UPI00249CEA5F|nr:cupin domain-containing protein [Pontibacterium granulatum]MDI3325019.1 cupin domain-containing protein [Pontibacterium granulatum]